MVSKAVEKAIEKLALSQFFCVALSGGVDSIVLLHIMAAWRHQHPDSQVRAIHVNHGLHPLANEWQDFCEAYCQSLHIPFLSESISIQDDGKEGIEAQARRKRYAAIEKQLMENENLLTAHHADDQAETVLLQLARGAGVKGLSAMCEKRRLGKAHLVRPLLSCSREQIVDYAKSHHLKWVEDESNQSSRFARNFLRHHVLPLCKKRWPHFISSLTRSASHCADTQRLLAEYVAQDYEKWADKTGALNGLGIRTLSRDRQFALLRHWIAQHHFQLPSTKQLNELYRTVVAAKMEAAPVFYFGDAEVRRFRHQLIIQKKNSIEKKDNRPDIITALYAQGLRKDIPAQELVIRFYQGGEKIRIAGKTFRHRLKKCWQQWNVPPWERSTIPLIYYKDELIAVLGYAIADEFLDEKEKGVTCKKAFN